MKKVLGLFLAVCLVFSFAAGALAAGRPTITKQPETATTTKSGSVSFSIKYSGSVNSITWHFVDPETGKDYTGKQIAKEISGLKVNGPNGRKISLSHVPESMHGWTVYAHLNGNGYKVDSDRVLLLVYGMRVPEEGPVGAAEPGDGDDDGAPAGDDGDEPYDEIPEDAGAAPDDDDEDEPPFTGADDDDDEDEPPVTGADDDDEPAGSAGGSTRVTVSCSSAVLFNMDDSGAAAGGDPSARLEFSGAGAFIVTSDEPIRNWMVNGIVFEPAEPVSSFRVTNVTADVTLELNVDAAAAAAAAEAAETAESADSADADVPAPIVIDENRICKIKCTGCSFTYLRGGLRSVTEGEVPYGAAISVIADTSGLADGGYRINGADPVNKGLASFRYTVTGDTEITMK